MQLQVFSEVGPLKKVLVHRPGDEVERMTPSLMEDLLFDDVIYSKTARREHNLFTGLMQSLGVEVCFFQDLLAAALEAGPKESLLKQIVQYENIAEEHAQKLFSLGGEDLARTLIGGLASTQQSPDHLFELDPLPNLLFSRDYQTVIGSKILFSSMKHPSRKRESLLSSFAFRYAAEISDASILGDLSAEQFKSQSSAFGAITIEGGDVLVFQENICIVGISERTSKQGVELLQKLLSEKTDFEHLIVVLMPVSRAQMHLDTIFTRISQFEALVYAPMILPGGSQSLGALTYSLKNVGQIKPTRPEYYDSLLGALSSLGVDLKPIYCGGRDSYISQAREQWTDGANALALGDGILCLYDRNEKTLEELSKEGFDIVRVREMDLTQQQDIPKRKTVFSLPSYELSRARGGPRCMSMPLQRAPI